MRTALIQIFQYINRFGLVKGSTLYYKNLVLKKGRSVFFLKGFPHQLTLRRSTSDIYTFNQIFIKLEYRFGVNFSPRFIIDCGANTGMASVYFKMTYPEAYIVAVEPEKSNYEMLVKNTQGRADIDCLRYGIWNKNAILKVEDEHNIGNWGFVCREVAEEDDSTVKALSISEIMRRYDKTEIDILKIDIEGCELELFSSDYENWLPRTKVIMIELHDWVRKGCSKSFFSAIIRYDFSVFQSGENVICVRN
jgi:FkbM family methyltransferase